MASDPLIWEVHPCYDRYQEPVFRDFFQGALDSKGALIVLDRKTQKIIGSSRYFWHENANELEIGWTFLARSHWGGVYNGEMKRLMLAHAFTFVDTVVFMVGVTNVRSRKALEKIGAQLTDRRFMRIMHGKEVEHVVYQIAKPTA